MWCTRILLLFTFYLNDQHFYLFLCENSRKHNIFLSDAYACAYICTGNQRWKLIPFSWLLLLTTEFYIVGFWFVWSMTCLLVTLKVRMCGGILAGYLKSWFCLHLLWQIVCPTCGVVILASQSTMLTLSQTQYGQCKMRTAKLRTMGSITETNYACEEQVGTRWGSSLVFHSMFVVGQMRSSLARSVFSTVIKVEGWVIYGWTGTDCRELCLGGFCCV